MDIHFRRSFTLAFNTTIRLREGRLHIRLSDLLEHAPDSVHQAIAHILLAKLYRKPIERHHNDRYRRYTQSEIVSRQAERIRQTRGLQTHHFWRKATSSTWTKCSSPSTCVFFMG